MSRNLDVGKFNLKNINWHANTGVAPILGPDQVVVVELSGTYCCSHVVSDYTWGLNDQWPVIRYAVVDTNGVDVGEPQREMVFNDVKILPPLFEGYSPDWMLSEPVLGLYIDGDVAMIYADVDVETGTTKWKTNCSEGCDVTECVIRWKEIPAKRIVAKS